MLYYRTVFLVRCSDSLGRFCYPGSDMDITEQYLGFCRQAAEALGRDAGTVQAWTPNNSCLPPVLDRSPFHQAAFRLHNHIQSAVQYIKEHSRDLVQVGRYVFV